MTETRILTLHPIPASAEAREQRLREIRESATVSDKMAAWRTLARLPLPSKVAA